ncbi:MAG: hypothetical protein J6X18_07120 [Bacteroidales bacterium]|nr:hypothetical protein [Bacteroidales bacterium]
MTLNSTNYVEIDGTYYVLDMDALSKYIVGDDNEKIIEKTKSERWVASDDVESTDMFLVDKDITETSSSRKDEHAPFRAEIAKMMLTLIMYPTVDSNGESKDIRTLNEPMTLGQSISFNTLISEGIIKEIEIEDEEE